MRIAITCECPHCHKPIFGQSLAKAEPVDIDVRSLMPNNRIPEIVKTISRQTGISEEDIYGKSRVAQISRARHLAWWACRSEGYPWKVIGDQFDVDHTSVIYGFNKINAEATQ